jgi:hypothetical protein
LTAISTPYDGAVARWREPDVLETRDVKHGPSNQRGGKLSVVIIALTSAPHWLADGATSSVGA